MENESLETQEPGTPEGDGPASLEQQLREALASAAAYRDEQLRAVAELENYRKRVAREIEGVRQFGVERLAAGLLPVLDSLELGLEAADTTDAATFVEGQRATLKLLLKVLHAAGVAAVDPAGAPFDPERHEAMTTRPAADAEPGTVLEVLQKGYVLNGRLLRPARVVVAAAPQA